MVLRILENNGTHSVFYIVLHIDRVDYITLSTKTKTTYIRHLISIFVGLVNKLLYLTTQKLHLKKISKYSNFYICSTFFRVCNVVIS